MKLAIVGSVRLKGNQEAYDAIRDFIFMLKPTEIISGGAEGIDTMAEEYADKLQIPKVIFRPKEANWNAYKDRNILVAGRCDELVRIVSDKTKTYGSGWTRDLADKMGKITHERVIHER